MPAVLSIVGRSQVGKTTFLEKAAKKEGPVDFSLEIEGVHFIPPNQRLCYTFAKYGYRSRCVEDAPER